MAAAEFKNVLLVAWSDDINDSTVVFLLTQTFEHQVVAHWLLVLDKVVGPAARFKHQWVGILADLALERLPEESGEIRACLGLPFDLKPAAKALQVDETYRARALAGTK